ncbi:choline dehydrogenase-like flavoprotein [Saonia flava]|uniref:Choline dehydrogenase-like flavoprotein n=1 Tax=Saonia flava TaxID=523696 RepID=A0A846QW47_9FLAO|nr:GMC family oxidoreductase [Saonia flava]NJB70503.1 choline dehydrogenase-like flavoprotein [Saonia flava]
MHIDARQLNNNSLIEGDICIIGAGAAGISIALDWMDTPYKVILLEGGGFEYDDKVQELYAGKTTGQKYYPLKSSRLHYFGGTTGHWAGMCSPFDDVDFKKRDWVGDSGWPITKKDLDPFYAKAHKPLQLGPYNYEYEYWNKELPNLNPFPLDEQVVWNKMWQYSQARFGKLYNKTIINSKNVHLYTYANVMDILTNESGTQVNEVTIKNHQGKTHKVRATHFIMACGATQNARLLLASNSQAPKGLGNDHDLVGRYFMEHLEIASAELWLFKRFPTDLYRWHYGKTKSSAELALTEEIQKEKRILNGTVSLSRLSLAKNLKPKIETWQDDDPRKSREKLNESYDDAGEASKNETGNIRKAFQLNTRIEQAPNPNSRVTLGKEKDALGMPKTQLHWELTALDKRSIRTIYQILGQQVGIAGIGRIKLHEFLRDPEDDTFSDSTNAGWHHMGTTRMSNNPKEGVVDSNCKVHGIGNLFVAGSACFTTSGAPNPTLTLVALSLRLSQHIKDIINNA